MKNDEAILAELEALKTRVAALEANAGLSSARIESPPAPKEEEGVSISYPADPNFFTMPNSAELKKLLAIVRTQYPELRPDVSNRLGADQAELEFYEGFTRAFLGIGNFGRLDKFNKKVGLAWWLSEAGDWLRRNNIQGDVPGRAFCAAVVAHGDIEFLPADGEQGWVWTFAMTPHGGRRATDAWKRVLQTSSIRILKRARGCRQRLRSGYSRQRDVRPRNDQIATRADHSRLRRVGARPTRPRPALFFCLARSSLRAYGAVQQRQQASPPSALKGLEGAKACTRRESRSA